MAQLESAPVQSAMTRKIGSPVHLLRLYDSLTRYRCYEPGVFSHYMIILFPSRMERLGRGMLGLNRVTLLSPLSSSTEEAVVGREV